MKSFKAGLSMKRVVFALLLLSLFFAPCAEARAESGAITGSCGDGLTWSIQDSTLTISGAGEMTAFPYPGARPWRAEIIDGAKRIVIGKAVLCIADYAFQGFYATSVSFEPGSLLQSIGKSAFQNCAMFSTGNTPLTITLPEGSKREKAYDVCFRIKRV